jgi:thiol:disulfide interchange protein DsbC
MSSTVFRSTFIALAAVASMHTAFADEAEIRKNLADRLPNLPAIDEITASPIPGLFEVRLGTEIVYTDDKGQYVLQGHMIDTKTRKNLTEARIDKLTAIDFSTLPLKDAIVWKAGNGERKLVVFSDPNCGYCKRLERDVQKLKNVTVYTFLYPILGPDSNEKAKNIWCSKEQTQTWLSWMLDAKAPPKTMGTCATPLERNVAMGQRYRVNGTPALVFADGTRVPGAMGADEIEKRLLASAGAKASGGK